MEQMATARGSAKKETKPRARKAQATEVVCIKGFDSDLKCRGFAYEVGKTYEHSGPVRMCSSGFHCINGNPLDVLDFYPLIGENGSLNRFCSVVASGEIGRDETSKIVCAKLTVSAEITAPELIRKSVAFVMDACKSKASKDAQAASGNFSKLAASGNYSKLEISGGKSAGATVGPGSSIRAKAGTPIAICEYDRNGNPKGFATGIAGKDCPADTWLIAKNGKLVPA